MFNIFLGLGIGGYGLYSIFNPTGDMNINFWLKFGGMTIIGLGIALYNSLPLLYSQLTKIKLPTLQTNKESPMAKELSGEIKVSNEQEQDFMSLFYLTERLKDDVEAQEALKTLNARIYNLHHPAKKV